VKRRLLLTLVFLTRAAVMCAVLLRWPASARPWYFGEEQCRSRLLGKTPQEVEAAIGARPNCFGRPWRERPELDSHAWRPGISAWTGWYFESVSIIVEYDDQERSVTAAVTWCHPRRFEKGSIEVSRK
jgi:hypothetical protein